MAACAEDNRASGGSEPPPRFARQRAIGVDGFGTLLLSNLIILLTAGASLFWQLRIVHRLAASAPTRVGSGDLVLVLGAGLKKDKPSRDFINRLFRAHELLLENPTRRVLVLGGKTGGNRMTEARVGAEYLVARGVPSGSVFTEHGSRHTLENLRQARATLTGQDLKRIVLISSRYHLARCEALANSLGIAHLLCAAEERLSLATGTLFQLAREAYYLHWFQVGRQWSRWTGNRRSLARIT